MERVLSDVRKKKAAKVKEAKDIRGIILLEPLQQLLMASMPKTNDHRHVTYDDRIGIVGFRAKRSCFHCLAQPVTALRMAKAWQLCEIVVGVTDLVGGLRGSNGAATDRSDEMGRSWRCRNPRMRA